MNVKVIFDNTRVNVDMTPVTFSVIPAKGADGDPGQPGPPGTIENLSVAATTLPAGSDATASYSGNTITFGLPTGATGATGKGISSIAKTGTSGLVDTYTITYTDNTTTTYTVTNGSGGTWGSITGTLSNQTDLYNALGAKADASDTYTKAQVDAEVANAGSKAIHVGFTTSSWTATTWSYDAVAAGAPSGGTCYTATVTASGASVGDFFAYGYSKDYLGDIYVTVKSNQFVVETSVQPGNNNSLHGVIVCGGSSNKETTRVLAENPCLIVDCGTISSLPATISNSSITADMVALKGDFGTPGAQVSDWTFTTAAGSMTISGTLATGGSTTLTLYLIKSR